MPNGNGGNGGNGGEVVERAYTAVTELVAEATLRPVGETLTRIVIDRAVGFEFTAEIHNFKLFSLPVVRCAGSRADEVVVALCRDQVAFAYAVREMNQEEQIQELAIDELQHGDHRDALGEVNLTSLTEFVINELDLCEDPDNCSGECDSCVEASEQVFEVAVF